MRNQSSIPTTRDRPGRPDFCKPRIHHAHPAIVAGICLALPAALAAEAKWPTFRAQELHQDRNEGIAIADYNGDGRPDISAGEFWYEGPAFTNKRPLRKLEPFGGGEYLTNNGEHALDLNLDGHPDILTGSFMESEMLWYENPGPEALQEGRLWKRHVLVETGLKTNEATLMTDIDGDGHPELLVNHWQDGLPMRYYKITPTKDGPKVNTITVADAGENTNGHGAGVGDLNGSGRIDILYKNGWYEQRQDGSWQRHADWTKPFMSLPALVLDVNGDGRNDMLWGNGHNYGLYWEEQLPPAADGTLRWRQHVIDDTWSQAHVLVWHDLDGDGRAELITGKRYYGHGGRDPGANDGLVLYAYKWQPEKQGFERHPIVVSEPASKQGPGVGLQLRVADLNGDGRPDLAATGKSGTYVIWNEGTKE
jgi:hypothetical protein